MINRVMLLGAALLALGACKGAGDGNGTAAQGNAAAAGRPAVAKGTLADALARPENARFAAAVRSVGMEPVLKGPGPYTLLLPSNAALAGAGDLGRDKERLTRLISNHVLPGTITAADIGKAIDARGGKAKLATMAGGTVTATRRGDRIVLTSGTTEATLTGAEERFGNGVIHRIDAVMSPAA